MTLTEILKKLCYYDTANPDCIIDDTRAKRKSPCYCDNCFHGLTQLAEELLKYKNK